MSFSTSLIKEVFLEFFFWGRGGEVGGGGGRSAKQFWRIVRTSEKILATPLVCQSSSPDFYNFCQCVENKIVISFIAANKSFRG